MAINNIRLGLILLILGIIFATDYFMFNSEATPIISWVISATGGIVIHKELLRKSGNKQGNKNDKTKNTNN